MAVSYFPIEKIKFCGKNFNGKKIACYTKSFRSTHSTYILST